MTENLSLPFIHSLSFYALFYVVIFYCCSTAWKMTILYYFKGAKNLFNNLFWALMWLKIYPECFVLKTVVDKKNHRLTPRNPHQNEIMSDLTETITWHTLSFHFIWLTLLASIRNYLWFPSEVVCLVAPLEPLACYVMFQTS